MAQYFLSKYKGQNELNTPGDTKPVLPYVGAYTRLFLGFFRILIGSGKDLRDSQRSGGVPGVCTGGVHGGHSSDRASQATSRHSGQHSAAEYSNSVYSLNAKS
jgi:hypothetical protein